MEKSNIAKALAQYLPSCKEEDVKVCYFTYLEDTNLVDVKPERKKDLLDLHTLNSIMMGIYKKPLLELNNLLYPSDKDIEKVIEILTTYLNCELEGNFERVFREITGEDLIINFKLRPLNLNTENVYEYNLVFTSGSFSLVHFPSEEEIKEYKSIYYNGEIHSRIKDFLIHRKYDFNNHLLGNRTLKNLGLATYKK
jgi:hypothetical protein